MATIERKFSYQVQETNDPSPRGLIQLIYRKRGWAKSVQPLMLDRNNSLTHWLIAHSTALR